MRPLFSRPHLKLTIDHDVVVLHPPPLNPSLAAPTQEDPELRGTVLLSLPSAQKLRSVQVVMKGLCHCHGGPQWPHMSCITLNKQLIERTGGESFQAGDHKFEFVMTIPSDSPESQGCNYGSLKYSVKAVVFLDSVLNSKVMSDAASFWIYTDPTRREEIPEPLEVYFEDYSADLGPIRVAISSPHFTVASLVHSSVTLFDPPSPIIITSIRTCVLETFKIHYGLARVAQPPATCTALQLVDEASNSSPSTPPPPTITVPPSGAIPFPLSIATPSRPSTITSLVPGTPFTYSRILRVPDEDHIRPTTSKLTKARIRASHALMVEVRYMTSSVQGLKEVKSWSLRRPVQILSCCSRVDYHLLPAYSSTNPHIVVKPVPTKPCICTETPKDILDRYAEALLQAGLIESAGTDRERLLGWNGDECAEGSSAAGLRRSVSKSPACTAFESPWAGRV